MARGFPYWREKLTRLPLGFRVFSGGISILISLGIALVIPKQCTEALQDDKFARITASVVDAGYGATYRDRITVVIIDDDSLPNEPATGSGRTGGDHETSTVWPPSYQFYADLFDDIGRYGPQFIFLDAILDLPRGKAYRRSAAHQSRS